MKHATPGCWLGNWAVAPCALGVVCAVLFGACTGGRTGIGARGEDGGRLGVAAQGVPLEELERQMVEFHREYEHAMLHPHVNKRFSEEFSEESLRRVLAETRDEQLALSVAHALAEFAIEDDSCRAVLDYVAEPRAQRRVGRTTNDSHYGVKISLIYLASRFDCEDCLATLRNWMRSDRSQEVVDRWKKGLSDVHQLEPAHWQAALQGRAAYGLVLANRQEDRRLVEEAYFAAVESLREIVAVAKPSSRFASPQVTYGGQLLDELRVAMALGRCVDAESSEICLKYLHSEPIGQNLIRDFLDESRHVYADIGWPEGF